jgi:hypothetical protein
VTRCPFDLTTASCPRQIYELQRTLDVDESGSIDLNEVFRNAPMLLKKMYE